ncbi:MAG: hypothetical protein RIQ81_35 [Pseudomonadota bacterium]|jgi:hypothetical protein
MDGVNNDRKPYFVTWRDAASGEMKRIRRMPPPKLHDLNPGDEATLDRRVGDDFKEGTNVTIEFSNPRHPNVLKLKNEAGQTTFVPYFDLTGNIRRFRTVDGVRLPVETPNEYGGAQDQYIDSGYLEWP